MPPIYSQEDTIIEFFEPLQDVTRQHCDEAARTLIGAPITPCPFQGHFSYSVYAGPQQDRVAQFRSEHLEEEVLQLAHSIFGRFVAKTIRHGFIGDISKLEFLETERIPGVTLIEAFMRSLSQTASLADPHMWRSNLVADFATCVLKLHCL